MGLIQAIGYAREEGIVTYRVLDNGTCINRNFPECIYFEGKKARVLTAEVRIGDYKKVPLFNQVYMLASKLYFLNDYSFHPSYQAYINLIFDNEHIDEVDSAVKWTIKKLDSDKVDIERLVIEKRLIWSDEWRTKSKEKKSRVLSKVLSSVLSSTPRKHANEALQHMLEETTNPIFITSASLIAESNDMGYDDVTYRAAYSSIQAIKEDVHQYNENLFDVHDGRVYRSFSVIEDAVQAAKEIMINGGSLTKSGLARHSGMSRTTIIKHWERINNML
jgi:hypothetical protein